MESKVNEELEKIKLTKKQHEQLVSGVDTATRELHSTAKLLQSVPSLFDKIGKVSDVDVNVLEKALQNVIDLSISSNEQYDALNEKDKKKWKESVQLMNSMVSILEDAGISFEVGIGDIIDSFSDSIKSQNLTNDRFVDLRKDVSNLVSRLGYSEDLVDQINKMRFNDKKSMERMNEILYQVKLDQGDKVIETSVKDIMKNMDTTFTNLQQTNSRYDTRFGGKTAIGLMDAGLKRSDLASASAGTVLDAFGPMGGILSTGFSALEDITGRSASSFLLEKSRDATKKLFTKKTKEEKTLEEKEKERIENEKKDAKTTKKGEAKTVKPIKDKKEKDGTGKVKTSSVKAQIVAETERDKIDLQEDALVYDEMKAEYLESIDNSLKELLSLHADTNKSLEGMESSTASSITESVGMMGWLRGWAGKLLTPFLWIGSAIGGLSLTASSFLTDLPVIRSFVPTKLKNVIENAKETSKLKKATELSSKASQAQALAEDTKKAKDIKKAEKLMEQAKKAEALAEETKLANDTRKAKLASKTGWFSSLGDKFKNAISPVTDFIGKGTQALKSKLAPVTNFIGKGVNMAKGGLSKVGNSAIGKMVGSGLSKLGGSWLGRGLKWVGGKAMVPLGIAMDAYTTYEAGKEFKGMWDAKSVESKAVKDYEEMQKRLIEMRKLKQTKETKESISKGLETLTKNKWILNGSSTLKSMDEIEKRTAILKDLEEKGILIKREDGNYILSNMAKEARLKKNVSDSYSAKTQRVLDMARAMDRGEKVDKANFYKAWEEKKNIKQVTRMTNKENKTVIKAPSLAKEKGVLDLSAIEFTDILQKTGGNTTIIQPSSNPINTNSVSDSFTDISPLQIERME